MTNQPNLDWQALYQSICKVNESIDKLEKSQEKLEKSQEKTDAQQAKTDAQLAKTDKKLEKIAMLMGNHTKNAGDVAEEFFYRGLSKLKQINQIKFDVVRRNIGSAKEYDIIMVNGNSVAVISVKYKLHTNDIVQFLEKDLPLFKTEFPEFRNYKLYGGIASMVVTDNLEKQAEDLGLFIFTQSGDKPKLLNKKDFEAKVL